MHSFQKFIVACLIPNHPPHPPIETRIWRLVVRALLKPLKVHLPNKIQPKNTIIATRTKITLILNISPQFVFHGFIPCLSRLGPWLFLLMINDLKIQDVSSWKFVDDTTISVVVQIGTNSQVQEAVTSVEKWSTENKLRLNAKKCEELVIDFKHSKHVFEPLTVNDNLLSVVKHAKICHLNLSSDLHAVERPYWWNN